MPLKTVSCLYEHYNTRTGWLAAVVVVHVVVRYWIESHIAGVDDSLAVKLDKQEFQSVTGPNIIISITAKAHTRTKSFPVLKHNM